ncbi:MAG TPA: MBL fold metallo-hydrolase [Anaerolineaceae bacterium]|nr:MBL fold metallo-hydrolase [Anaerolineaceae bacterium]HQN03924.1 MBL fold metallo-hydrolase [Anaerolineaceae bacterium]HQP08048.1 MBL fold metallo-hydrolase [Anaerolineaceae bacterium]
MQRERVSENVFWFQSEIYAQVTAGVITGPQWAVVIDTLAMPEETLAMRTYIEEELAVPVRYVINTHYHADHSWGNSYFPNATVVSSKATRVALAERAPAALETARRQNPSFQRTRIILPHMTFDSGELNLRVGKKNLILMNAPGHSQDGIMVLVEEDRVLFASDSFMPLPYIVDGNLEDLTATIKHIGRMGLENIVQGHGDIILRGEIDDAVKENLAYLAAIRKAAKTASRRRDPENELEKADIDSCGKSRVLLAGLAGELHRRNLRHLLRQYTADEDMLTI